MGLKSFFKDIGSAIDDYVIQPALGVATAGAVGGFDAYGNVIKEITGQEAAEDAANAINRQATANAATFSPYKDLGVGALDKLKNIYGLGPQGGKGLVDIQSLLKQMPGYSAGLDAGSDAITRNAAARGIMGSGTLANLFSFGQRYAGDAFNSYTNNLLNMSNIGLSGTSAAAGQNMTAANATAAKSMGEAQMYQNLLGMGVQAAGMAFGGPAGAAVTGGLTNEQWGQQQADLARSNYNIPLG